MCRRWTDGERRTSVSPISSGRRIPGLRSTRSSPPARTTSFRRLSFSVPSPTSIATSSTRMDPSSRIPPEGDSSSRYTSSRRMIAPHRRPTFLLSVAFFFFVASLNCGRATGSDPDPIDHEAEDALVTYLRIDTTNPPGNETAGARFLQQLLIKGGIEAKLVGSNPARQSVYARLRSGSNEKALLLLNHIDVVPAAAEEWTKPPFSGLRSGCYIWARGALDMKSLAIA